MKFEIVETAVQSRKITSKKNGKEYTFHTQDAYFHDGQAPYPVRCVVSVPDVSSFYNPGWYTFSPGAIYVDRFGNPSIGRFTLVPLTA